MTAHDRSFEDLGRRLVQAIAAEFAGHGPDEESSADDDRASRWPTSDAAGHLLDWIDLVADLARDAVNTVVDTVASGLRDPARVLALEGGHAGGPVCGEFWLHSASGSASSITPVLSVLRSDDRSEVPVTIEPRFADVEEGRPARFVLTVGTLAAAEPGDYWGVVEAAGVQHELTVRLRVIA